ncbi:MAG: PhoH family protein [Phycisphaerae bacterium]|nr:PhoH family protein [Phycisphaerae bacterium]
MDITITVPPDADRVAVLGSAERHLKILREALGVAITARGREVRIRGERDPVRVARRVVERLAERAAQGRAPDRRAVLDAISEESELLRREQRLARPATEEPDEGQPPRTADLRWNGELDVYAHGRPVRARKPNQQFYLDAIRDHDLVFAIGPAGTGKTYLGVAAAIHLLKSGRVSKVILARPAVEAGERLGFLPGDLQAKVNPYLRPLFDAVHDMMDFPTIRRFMDNDVVEVVPLAFMRGRTLNNAVIILDEAQNATVGQMKMFLTRMGQGSKTIVTGDVTQIDLGDPRQSGLIDAARRLRRVPGVAFVAFDQDDVVRHDLVRRIIDAYGEEDAGATRRRRPPPVGTPPTEPAEG